MKNIFAKFQEYVKKPKRNVFDLSFRNNLTLKFGQLTPVFCKEVVPGDSFKIDTKFGLMLMPMKFPVQTPMKAYVHFFYVRNRNLWKDWQDFIGGTKENLVLPYVQPVDKHKFYRIGGIADYFGVPNTLYAGASGSDNVTYQGIAHGMDGDTYDSSNPALYIEGGQSNNTKVWYFLPSFFKNDIVSFNGVDNNPYNNNITEATMNGEIANKSVEDSVFVTTSSNWYRAMETFLTESGFANHSQNNDAFRPFYYAGDFPAIPQTIDIRIDRNPFYLALHSPASMSNLTSNIDMFCLCYDSNGKYKTSIKKRISFTLSESLPTSIMSSLTLVQSDFVTSELLGCTRFKLGFYAKWDSFGNPAQKVSMYGDVYTSSDAVNPAGIVNISELASTPYDSDIHLSALPFRAYESIYNAYYRNPQNNPFILNGVPEYNRYLTTNEGGSDNTQYDLYFRNWEYDFLTSAVQSPQQGVAPLVGMSVTGEATFQDEEGNTYYAQALMNDQGEITGWQSHSSNMPVGSLRLLMDMAGTGISINDLRNVNAFQRFLENNIRHGLKYKDQIMSHFGVKVRYDELDMPEFIGGCSAEMEVYKVTQTSNSGDTPLGSFVGQAQVKKEFGHSVTHYCDEHGYIIGIMSVVPVPVYSQLLPKYFIKNSQLDFFFPEFGHIGYQPILQKEVSPLQTYYSNSDLNKVFGYNRAWYEYLASTDEVHSQFRTTMRDFIMNRTFQDEPELSEEFLLVDPDQLNDVFLAGTEDDDLYAPEADKIIGSLLFNVSAKRPIPLFGIPKLEG